MSTYASVQRERACTSLAPSHCVEPREAETVTNYNIPYIVLRCQACDRPQGLRYIPKEDRP